MPRTLSTNLELCSECVCFAARKAARRLTRLYDDSLAGTDLRSTQFTLLVLVHEVEKPSINSLATALGSDATTVTRNVRGLVRRGMLLTKAGDDRRERQVRLNPAGITALKAAFPHWQRTHLRVVETLGVEELARLRTLLDKVGGLSGSE